MRINLTSAQIGYEASESIRNLYLIIINERLSSNIDVSMMK